MRSLSIDSNLDKLAKLKPGWQLFPCTTGWEGALRKCRRGLATSCPTRNRHPRHACRCARDGRRHPHTQIKTTQLRLTLSWYFAGNGRGEKTWLCCHTKTVCCCRYYTTTGDGIVGQGKDLDGNIVHQGIAVYGNKGSTDQHAYVQQLREGVPNFFMTY